MSTENKITRRIRNEVCIRGNVVGKFTTPKTCVVILATRNALTGKVDFPRVTFYGVERSRSVFNDINKGDKLRINCMVETRERQNNIYLAGISYDKEMSRIEAEFAGEDYSNNSDINKCLLQGYVGHVYKHNDDCTLISLGLGRRFGKFNVFPSLVFFGDKALKAAELKKGDNIQVIAYVQSRRTEKDGKQMKFQSLVGQEFRLTPTDNSEMTIND